jgi:hypothetical protein
MLFNAAAIVSVLSFNIAVQAAPAPQFGILIAMDPCMQHISRNISAHGN